MNVVVRFRNPRGELFIVQNCGKSGEAVLLAQANVIGGVHRILVSNCRKET